MDLDTWLAKIRQARTHREVFAILDEFRKHDWADDQCSKMSRLYMRVLENLGPADAQAETDESSAVAASQSTAAAAGKVEGGNAPVNDGPVWYEKM